MLISDLVILYLEHARSYYRKPKSRRVTKEYPLIEQALQPLLTVGGAVDADDADAALIASARRWLLSHTENSRTTVNGKIARMVRMFRWAADPEQAFVSAVTLAKVQAVRPLKYGRSSAAESEGVEPVERERVEQLLGWLFDPMLDGRRMSKPVMVSRRRLATMIEVQLESGMRPGEVCSMRREDLERFGGAWIYTPAEHKSEHRGQERRILIPGEEQGSSAASVLERWLSISKVESGALFEMTPDSYRRAIARHLKARGAESWSPHQLRHTMATETADQHGLQTAQVLLGHASIKTTERYVGADMQMQAVISKLSRASV